MKNRLTRQDMLTLEACTGFPFVGDIDMVKEFISKTLNKPLGSVDLALQDTYFQCRQALSSQFKQVVAKMRTQADINLKGLSDYYKEET